MVELGIIEIFSLNSMKLFTSVRFSLSNSCCTYEISCKLVLLKFRYSEKYLNSKKLAFIINFDSVK